MMKQFYFLCSLLVVAILSSCSKDIAEEATTGSIAGSVSDRTTGEPVATVNVTITPGGSSTVTGSDGTFTFRNLYADEYTLSISKEGYKPNSSSVTVRTGDPTSAHLLIERIPNIVTADRELLDFGSNASVNTMAFNIINPSYEDLEWEIEERCDWIVEVKPQKGMLRYGKTEAIVVVIDREVLPSGGNEAILVVRSSNGSTEVKVIANGSERYAPKLNTLEATEITASTAVFNGEIIDSGVPSYTERGFVYSLTTMPTIENTIAKLTSPVTKESKYSYSAKDLKLDESYYVRAYAVNSVGVAYSTNEVKVSPVASSPKLTVKDVTNMKASTQSVTFNGQVDNVGDPAYFERGFVYSTTSNPTTNNNKIKTNGNGTGTFSADITGLQLNQKYYVRAYAINSVGTTYSSNEIDFTLKATLPNVSTLEILDADLSTGTATFRGTIVSAGDPAYTERGFVYSTMHEPTINDNVIKANGNGATGSYSVYVENLPKTTYYVRAYATNLAGTAYGEEMAVSEGWVVLSSLGIAVQKEDIGYNYWESVNSMCENSTLGGYTDWRLPTKEELMSLYVNKDNIGNFKTTDPTGYAYEYWSNSQYSSDSHYYINFNTGDLKSQKNNYSRASGRCVRTLNNQ